MRTVSACAGVVSTTPETVVQTAATVSEARREEDLLGNGIPPGTYVGAGTKVEYGAAAGGRRDARRSAGPPAPRRCR
ncbi:hypothetical protein GCM10022207_21060 [Streptomyces lannensis]|uniref:Fumarylacetoacetase-like C-terminal domain-containing protein n=1 Tax=Streptomyces lannensis TaxID=766498 RepID=A0ABP7JWH9_9ACTN